MKNEKGITLIALIITIIVMLILVGVTINIAINGGLFGTAREATVKMEEQAIYDEIVGMAKFKNNGDVDVSATYSAIQANFGTANVSELGEDGAFTVTGKNGIYKYTLTTSKISIYSDSENDIEADIAFLEEFLLVHGTEDFEAVGITIIDLEGGTLTYNGNTFKAEYNPNTGKVDVSLYTYEPAQAKAWGDPSSALIIRTADDNIYYVMGNTVFPISSLGASLTNCYITDFGETFTSTASEISNGTSMDLVNIDTTQKYDFITNNGDPSMIYIPSTDSWNGVGESSNTYIYVFNDPNNIYSGDISGYLAQIEALNNGD